MIFSKIDFLNGLTKIMIIISLCSVLASSNHSYAQTPGKKNIEAVFIYNFLKFITWPENYESGTYIIQVYGDDEILNLLKVISEKKNVSGTPISPLNIKNIEEFSPCHILFISKSRIKDVNNILIVSENIPVLIVSDCQPDESDGIDFFLNHRNDKIKLIVDLESIERKQLKVSSHLLKLSEIIQR